MSQLMSTLMLILGGLLCAAIAGGLLYRFGRNYLSVNHKANAVVLNKRTVRYEHYSQLDAPKMATDFILDVSVGSKKLSFKTSEWKYNSVNIGDKRVITYKGTRLIDI